MRAKSARKADPGPRPLRRGSNRRRGAGRSVRAVPEAAAVAALGPAPSGGRTRRRWIFGSAKHSLPTATVERSRRHRLTLMDRLFLAVIVSALVLLVFSSALLVDRSQSPVMLTERPEKAQGGRP